MLFTNLKTALMESKMNRASLLQASSAEKATDKVAY
jgi:hypothetical protein